jgi:hypothetical protein
MNLPAPNDLFERKTAIRKQAHENRKNQPEKDAVSVQIVDRFMTLPENEASITGSSGQWKANCRAVLR